MTSRLGSRKGGERARAARISKVVTCYVAHVEMWYGGCRATVSADGVARYSKGSRNGRNVHPRGEICSARVYILHIARDQT